MYSWGQWKDVLEACDFRKRQLGVGDVENISRTIVSLLFILPLSFSVHIAHFTLPLYLVLLTFSSLSSNLLSSLLLLHHVHTICLFFPHALPFLA